MEFMKDHPRENIDYDKVHQVVDAMVEGDWAMFVKRRIEVMPEGFTFKVENIDLSQKDLSKLPASFLSFHDCDLRGVSFKENDLFVTSFKNCDLRGADFRGCTGQVYAINSDLRDIQIDEATDLWQQERFEKVSMFEDCKFNKDTRAVLEQAGVEWRIPENRLEEFEWG